MADKNKGGKIELIHKTMTEHYKLSAKASRLYKYILEFATNKKAKSPTVGVICKTLHTTPFTLISKTIPELRKYDLWFE
jgi:hypothetical protein